ncbi:MAG: hypothetical protein ACM3N6_10560 [Betaproteobacteria bacterium]
MEQLLLWIGRLAGWIGVLVVAAAVAARLTGTWVLGGYSVGTMLQGGMAAMLLACLAYCASLAERSRG